MSNLQLTSSQPPFPFPAHSKLIIQGSVGHAPASVFGPGTSGGDVQDSTQSFLAQIQPNFSAVPLPEELISEQVQIRLEAGEMQMSAVQIQENSEQHKGIFECLQHSLDLIDETGDYFL